MLDCQLLGAFVEERNVVEKEFMLCKASTTLEVP